MQDSQNSSPVWHGTTILTVRKGGKVVVGGDGQVSIGQTVIKSNAKKVRKLGKGDVIGGFAGATADAFTLFELGFEPLEKRERIRGRAGKTADYVAFPEPPHFLGVGLDDRLADRDLAVAADHDFAALADSQDGRAVPDRRLVLRCLHGIPSCRARFRGWGG